MNKHQRGFTAVKRGPSPATANQINKRRQTPTTNILSLDPDIVCTIFAFLDMFDLVRCSLVCKLWYLTHFHSLLFLFKQFESNDPQLARAYLWRNAIVESRSLREFCERNVKSSSSEFTEKPLRVILREVAMEHHGLALQRGGFYVDQWKGHSTTYLNLLPFTH